MKKTILAFISMLFLAVGCMFTSAGDDFYFYVHYDEQLPSYEPVDVYYRITNTETSRLDDMNVRVMIPDLGIYEVSRSFDVRRGDSYSGFIAIELPSGIPPGEYLVRFIASDEESRRVKHRYIIIE